MILYFIVTFFASTVFASSLESCAEIYSSLHSDFLDFLKRIQKMDDSMLSPALCAREMIRDKKDTLSGNFSTIKEIVDPDKLSGKHEITREQMDQLDRDIDIVCALYESRERIDNLIRFFSELKKEGGNSKNLDTVDPKSIKQIFTDILTKLQMSQNTYAYDRPSTVTLNEVVDTYFFDRLRPIFIKQFKLKNYCSLDYLGHFMYHDLRLIICSYVDSALPQIQDLYEKVKEKKEKNTAEYDRLKNKCRVSDSRLCLLSQKDGSTQDNLERKKENFDNLVRTCSEYIEILNLCKNGIIRLSLSYELQDGNNFLKALLENKFQSLTTELVQGAKGFDESSVREFVESVTIGKYKIQVRKNWIKTSDSPISSPVYEEVGDRVNWTNSGDAQNKFAEYVLQAINSDVKRYYPITNNTSSHGSKNPDLYLAESLQKVVKNVAQQIEEALITNTQANQEETTK